MPAAFDVVIEVRDRDLNRTAQVDPGVVKDGKFVRRKDAVGAWQLTLPNEHPAVDVLRQPGAGVLVWLYDVPYLSGPCASWVRTESAEDPIGSTTFTGPDDVIVLFDHVCYPQPSNPDFGSQQSAYDTRTGPVETVVKGYVDANLGPSAPPSRRGLLGSYLRVAPDQQRGTRVTASARFDVVGEQAAALTTVDGGYGFTVLQDPTARVLTFEVYPVRDRVGEVRMDVDNDLLQSTQSGITAPTVTRALIAGQGEGVQRQLFEVTDAQAVAAETAWGRRVERFIDQRQTAVVTELQQAGTKAIIDGGRTAASLKVVPKDQTTMRYGLHWGVGDTVGVVVDGQVLADTVSEAVVAVDAGDLLVGATVGTPSGYDWEAAVTDSIVALDVRLSLLERAV